MIKKRLIYGFLACLDVLLLVVSLASGMYSSVLWFGLGAVCLGLAAASPPDEPRYPH